MNNTDLHLPPTYKRQRPTFWDDFTVPDGEVWQPDVYELALSMATDFGPVPIIDVGCGSARKLHHWKHGVIGIDAPPTIARLQCEYPDGTWISDDFEDPHPIDAEGSIVICADVLEHLWKPQRLLQVLADSGAIAVVLSTPDRELARGADHMGPPPHAPHAQEWTREEFTSLVADYMKVQRSEFTRTSTHGPEKNTVLVVAQ